jgi:hypothetical protein
VNADWGFGKTHLQMLLVETFLRRQIPFVYDNVDGKSGSLAHLHRTVPRWMESIQSGTYRGIRSIAEGELSDRRCIDTWCRHRGSSFSKHLVSALDGREWEWNLVVGHQYQFPDYSYNHAKGLEILEDFASLLSGLSMGGIVLMLDEAENVTREHDIRGRKKAYETLQKLSQSRNLFIIVFITERFFQQIDDDRRRGIAAAWDLWTPDAKHFVTGIERVPIARPPQITASLANAIVDRIIDVYSQAFHCHVAQQIKERVLELWRQTATKSVRLLVRIAIDTLDRCRN